MRAPASAPADAAPAHVPGVTERWYPTEHCNRFSGLDSASGRPLSTNLVYSHCFDAAKPRVRRLWRPTPLAAGVASPSAPFSAPVISSPCHPVSGTPMTLPLWFLRSSSSRFFLVTVARKCWSSEKASPNLESITVSLHRTTSPHFLWYSDSFDKPSLAPFHGGSPPSRQDVSVYHPAG